MDNEHVSRRQFMHKTAATAAGIAVGLGAVGQAVNAADAATDTSKIPSYNSNMEYRRLGKTNIMVSAVGLGGHSRSNVKERTEIISRCLDAGINYIDACWDNEVKRDAQALRGRRDKAYLALSHGAKEVRQEEYRTSKKLLQSLDELLRDSKQDYTDLWRITCYEPGGRHTFNTSCEIVEALEKAKKQGKARFLGFSSHDRRWIKFMIEYFPQIEVVCFPFTTMTKRAPKDSLFDALKQRDVGAFGIKPFAAASLFARDGDPEKDNRRGRLALRYILHSNTVHPIPGMNRMEEVENVVKAVAERRQLDVQERVELETAGRETWAALPNNYQWLKNWQYV
ncbi:MAG: aldo/keto reductase [Planctomycetota bacterium]|jgi:aryl-alcohol dehydrogenase-like predicted oxidoreductase